MTIIDDIQSGNESVFTAIYQQFHKKLYYYFLNKTGSADSAKDLVQLTFIKFWNFRHTLSNEYSVDAQLFVMAKTSFIDYLRQQAVYRQKMITYALEETNAVNKADTTSITPFEVTNFLQIAIDRLSNIRKNVFILSRVKGLSNRQIAEKLSISVKTVEDHMTKAIRHIRSISSL